jgi:uncharacterized membrane protein
MNPSPSLWPALPLLPVLLVHIGSTLAALILGAWMLAARKGTLNHRRVGWVWVVLMGVAALSSLLIAPRSAFLGVTGLSPIHVLTLVTIASLVAGIWAIRRRNRRGHQITMTVLYVGGCVVAGAFTLLPGRMLGNLLWHQGLGLLA